jgi:hypothetical protein
MMFWYYEAVLREYFLHAKVGQPQLGQMHLRRFLFGTLLLEYT